jgi:parvulin-like peptidyl-prolyl isomerase
MLKNLPVRLLALALAVGLVAAACSDDGGVAATVDGVDITVADVELLIAETTEMTDELFAQSLSTLIQWRITERAAADQLGVELSDDEVAEQVDRVLAEFGASSVAELAESQGISVELFELFVRQLVIQDEVTAALEASAETPDDATVAAELADNPLTWTVVCAGHVLVETEAEAIDALTRLQGGESLAEVAAEVSTDPGSAANGGDLGCTTPSEYVAEFGAATMEAPIDEPFGPVESAFGFHVIVVASRTEATPDEVRTVMMENATIVALDDWFSNAVAAADVTVDEQYGQWITEPSPQVVLTG